jgi:tetratricopeptide (TPR) repeat protein
VLKKPGVSSDGNVIVIDTSTSPARSIDHETPPPLRFDWPEEVAAAAYRRGASLWLVFDRPPPRDLTIELARLVPQFGPYEQFEAAGATLIRMAAPPVLVPSLRKEGAAWIVDLWSADRAATPDIETSVDGAAQSATVSFAMPDAGRLLSLQDPDLGDRIIVVPVTGAGHGLSQSREYPQFRAIESYQGLIVQPFSEEIEVTLADGAAQIRDAGGLVISFGGNLARVESDVSVPPTGPRLLDPAAWRRGGGEQFLNDKQELQTALSNAVPEQLGVARMDLARFYFAHGLSAETLGVLRLRQDADARLGMDPQSRLMTGASEFLIDDFENAAKDLFDPSLEGEWEAELWHAAFAAASHDWALAARRFARTEPLIAAYPHAIRTRLRLLAAEANLGLADTVAADRYLEQIRADSPSHGEEAQVAYLVGRRLQLEGDIEDAVAMWNRVLDSRHPPSQTRARVALLDLGLEQGLVSPEQALQELERLRFAWRGDRFEFALLQRLGDLYIAQHDYRQGLRALRQAASYFPDSGRAQAVVQRMRDVFVNLYLGNAATELPPLRALAMYEEFKELTPPGDRGDQVVGTLVDRLVEVDLLDRAAVLLTAQIRYRLTGADKARAGSRLAMIRLLDRSPGKAIDAIEISAEPNLPAELNRERRHLRVRALSQLGRYDAAMSELGKDDDAEAMRLRADMLWAQRDWPAAAVALGRLVPAAPDADKPLSEADSRAVLDLAVALTLSGERDKLAALGKAYGEVMRTQPSALTFAMLIGNPQGGQNKSIAEELAQVAEVEAFMANYRERLQQQQAAAQ